jgi:hypothetical protein
MQHFLQHTVALSALASLLLSTAALADSSSAFSASSTAIGSVSTSVEKSSDVSSGKKHVVQGRYTLVAMAPLEQQPEMLRLHLVAATPGASTEVSLLVPRQAVSSAQLVVGQTIAAEQRTYGLALAGVAPSGETSTFFLILGDAWFHELESRPVLL